MFRIPFEYARVLIIPLALLGAGAHARFTPESVKIQLFFADPMNYHRFGGAEGRLRLAELMFKGHVDAASTSVRRALGADYRHLKWGPRYVGSVKRYREDRARLTAPDALERWGTPAGYAEYVRLHGSGRMATTFNNAVAVMGLSKFILFNWGRPFSGPRPTYLARRARVIDADGVRAECRGATGQRDVADLYNAGNTDVAARELFAVLTNAEWLDLGWSRPNHPKKTRSQPSTVDQSLAIDYREQLLVDGEPRPQFTNKAGYVNYADAFHGGHMAIARTKIAGALTRAEIESLGWGRSFTGTTDEFIKIRSFLFSQGMAGARRRWSGKMTGLDQVVAAYLRLHPVNQLEPAAARRWTRGQFRAVVTAKEMLDLDWVSAAADREFSLRYDEALVITRAPPALIARPLVLRPDAPKLVTRPTREHLFINGARNPMFEKKAGYVAYADLHHRGDMAKARVKASVDLSPAELEAFEWGPVFQGSTALFMEMREFLFVQGLQTARKLWFGKAVGLKRLTEAYLETYPRPHLPPDVALARARVQFHAVVTTEEKLALGWNSTTARFETTVGCEEALVISRPNLALSAD